jgi:hypothetical protein
MEQQWNMQVADDADCKLGHFYSSRGETYDVVKQEMDSTKLFAIFPNAATQLSGFSLFLFIWETSVYLHDVCFNQEVCFVI